MATDPYTVLELPPDAGPDEVHAAYDRLRALYSPERFVDGPPEFVERAADRRAQLAAAYQALASEHSGQLPPTSAVERPVPPLAAPDYRPLPPAAGVERPVPSIPVPASRATPRVPRRPLLATTAILMIGAVLYASVALPGVRTTRSAAALATPTLPSVTLPYNSAQIEQLRAATQHEGSAPSWVALGNALFDNLETLREAAPLSPQYQNAARGWPEIVAAYRAALAQGDDPNTRSDLAVALVYNGIATNDQATIDQAVAEAQRARAAAPTAGRVAVNTGLVLVALNPPRTAEALQLWQAEIARDPHSDDGQRAQQLIDSYK